ncbi:MAG: DUF4394 domain-containing protein [Thermoleophilaceae bacterium]
MSRRPLKRAAVALACASAAALATSAPALADETAVGLSTDSPSSLVTFPVTNPSSAQTASITFPMGAMDTNLVGLDYRPRSNQLYAYGSLGTLYVLNPPATPGGAFAAVQVSAGLGAFPAAADTGLDFNPMADAIRVVNENDENYRFNPLNGNGGAGTAAGGRDSNLNPGDPNVVAAGYTNDFDGTTSTELFDIDSGSDVLFKQNPPNAGTLELRGMLGVNTTDNAGLDVAQGSKVAYAALELAGSPGSSTLHTINLANGAATPVGAIGGGEVIESLSVVPASVIAFAVGASAVSESGGQAQIAVVRSGPENRTATVDYSSSGGGPSGTLTFEPGQTTKLITVPVSDDAGDGADRQIALTLANPGANALVGARDATTLTIVDDDDRPVSPPAKPKSVDAALKLGRHLLDRARLRLDDGSKGRGTLELSRSDRRALARALARGKAGSLTLKVRVR